MIRLHSLFGSHLQSSLLQIYPGSGATPTQMEIILHQFIN